MARKRSDPELFERYARDEMDEQDRLAILEILAKPADLAEQTIFHVHGNIYELTFNTVSRTCYVDDIIDVGPSGCERRSFDEIAAFLERGDAGA